MPGPRKRKQLLFTAVLLGFVIALGGCGLGATRPVEQLQETHATGAEATVAVRAPVPREPAKGESGWNRADSPGESEEIPQGSDGASPGVPLQVSLPRFDRKVIKNADLTLRVNDTHVAVDQLTGIAADYDGFIVSSRAWSEGHHRMATVTLSVPVDTFEQVLRRLRGIAVEVLEERADGEDVTDQYVDLESRLRNLEATQTRIRSFLDQAVTVEEALEVNRRLSEVEGQIENIKGKMNYLTERAAYSTITVHLQPERPAPTPTPTPTLPAWEPVETVTEAGNTLMVILRFLGDLAIWLAVVFLPFLIPTGFLAWMILRWAKRHSQHDGRNGERTGSPDE